MATANRCAIGSMSRIIAQRSRLALDLSGASGEVYNIGGDGETLEHRASSARSVRSRTAPWRATRTSRGASRSRFPRGASSPRVSITHVRDRPGHDRRYAIDFTKAREGLGYRPARNLSAGLESTLDWYLTHTRWWQVLLGRDYAEWLDKNYTRGKAVWSSGTVCTGLHGGPAGRPWHARETGKRLPDDVFARRRGARTRYHSGSGARGRGSMRFRRLGALVVAYAIDGFGGILPEPELRIPCRRSKDTLSGSGDQGSMVQELLGGKGTTGKKRDPKAGVARDGGAARAATTRVCSTRTRSRRRARTGGISVRADEDPGAAAQGYGADRADHARRGVQRPPQAVQRPEQGRGQQQQRGQPQQQRGQSQQHSRIQTSRSRCC